MTQRYGEEGLFARWRDRLSQALLREPALGCIDIQGFSSVEMSDS